MVRRGRSFSLSLPFDEDGPQFGWKRRVNPVHTMMSTGMDTAEQMGLPHGLSVADDAVFMPLQCSTQWDGLGHVFDHGVGWNGRPGREVVTSEGDFATGIERLAAPVIGRGVLLDVGRALGEDGELADRCPITGADLDEPIRRQGGTSAVGRGWGSYAGGPAPGLSFDTLAWLHRTEIAAVATETWGMEVRPNEWPDAALFAPLLEPPSVRDFLTYERYLAALAGSVPDEWYEQPLFGRRLLHQHLQPGNDSEHPAPTFWPGIDLNLTSATLEPRRQRTLLIGLNAAARDGEPHHVVPGSADAG
ncbi:cyclase family protein [Amycolatopsis sp. A133]|uniref:cyclase family protein n=1 Tax=Amycolatopsis sp. A133 TaxID=3064472 RepID=UPI0027FA357E|nr:cyclase family protein [Amycolatopsis sp. A133]MDQ7807346.1 cyclase family protein [Amycolatopsis sp. A133]